MFTGSMGIQNDQLSWRNFGILQFELTLHDNDKSVDFEIRKCTCCGGSALHALLGVEAITQLLSNET